MRFTPRFMFAVIALFAATTLASAQVPSFRNKGYKGSISFTDHYGVFVGAETSLEIPQQTDPLVPILN